MIPTMLLAGLLVGRWAAVPLGGLAWAAALLASGTLAWSDVPVAVALAGANVAVGVAARQVIRLASGRPRTLT